MLADPQREERDTLPAVTTRFEVLSHWLRQRLNRSSLLRGLATWGRCHSLDHFPLVTQCCLAEYIAALGPRYALASAESDLPRLSPRHADLLIVGGAITPRLAPVLLRTYDAMPDPKWVMSFGSCASTGGIFHNYAVLQGIDTLLPVAVYVPGCPPQPEQLMQAMALLGEKIRAGMPGASDSG